MKRNSLSMFTVFDPQGISRPYTQGVRHITDNSISRIQKISPIHGEHHKLALSQVKNKNPYHQLDDPKPPRTLIYAEDIMTNPVETHPHDFPISQALDLFRAKRFRHFPVTNLEGVIIGILSDRDIFYAHLLNSKSNRKVVGDIMTSPVLTASPKTEIRSIAKVMFDEHIGALPIIGDLNRIVGIVTRSDILRGLLKHGSIELWS